MTSFLAFDLGAESGRAILGELDGGRLVISELHRFLNKPRLIDGHLHWDLPSLFEEIKQGLSICAKGWGTPAGMGIDTWGVDFGLLDGQGELIELPYVYRDHRIQGAMESFFAKMEREQIYRRTGIQFLPFNTLYQLEAMVQGRSPALGRARDLLFVPDLFCFLLTGKKRTEFTFATTSQMFNPIKGGWDEGLLAALGLPMTVMQILVQPGTVIGHVTKEIADQTGIGQAPFVAVATHDTGSAVAAVPASGSNFAYISSGTWSLMGVESSTPIITDESLAMNFTNEGGVGGGFRVLKNIMGLWLVQGCRKKWNIDYTELTVLAERAKPLGPLIDPDHSDFLNPPDMPEAICAYCRKTGQPAPRDKGGIVRCALESLALKYRFVLEQLRRIHPAPIEKIQIIGGGAQNRLLCRFTADATGLPVHAGPVEATAIGNLLVQAMALGEVSSLGELRAIVGNSFEVTTYEPQECQLWEEAWNRFRNLLPQEARRNADG